MKVGDLVKYVWGKHRLHGIIVGEEDVAAAFEQAVGIAKEDVDWTQPIWKVWTGDRILTFYESNLRVV